MFWLACDSWQFYLSFLQDIRRGWDLSYSILFIQALGGNPNWKFIRHPYGNKVNPSASRLVPCFIPLMNTPEKYG